MHQRLHIHTDSVGWGSSAVASASAASSRDLINAQCCAAHESTNIVPTCIARAFLALIPFGVTKYKRSLVYLQVVKHQTDIKTSAAPPLFVLVAAWLAPLQLCNTRWR